jgi:hypothetical protein
VLLTSLVEGQEATVLQLPAQPATATEVRAEKPVALLSWYSLAKPSQVMPAGLVGAARDPTASAALRWTRLLSSLVEIQEWPEKRCGGEVVHGERAMGIVIDISPSNGDCQTARVSNEKTTTPKA